MDIIEVMMLEGSPVTGSLRPDEGAVLARGSRGSVTYDGCSGGIDSCVEALNRYITDNVNVPHYSVSYPNDSDSTSSSLRNLWKGHGKKRSVVSGEHPSDSLVKETQNSHFCSVTTADDSNDDPFAELRSATQRNTYSYGEFEEFNIGSPPSGRSAVSCPNCNFYTQTDEVVLDPGPSKNVRHQGSLNRHLKIAKHCMKVFARKPLDAAAKFTRYCKKQLT